MPTSSSQRSKHPRESSSSITQVAQMNKSIDGRESRKKSDYSGSAATKREAVSRRKSTPRVRNSRSSLTPKTTVPSQRSRSNLHRTTVELDNEDEGDEGESIDDLNASFASTATVNMGMSQTPQNDPSPPSGIITNHNAKKVPRKYDLINTYFTKADTGGYLCKLCDGTKNSNKVSIHPSISHVKNSQFNSSGLNCMIDNALRNHFRGENNR